VLERFNLKAARDFLGDAMAKPGTKLAPRYDRILRRSVPDGVPIDVPADPVIIVEGVIALADPALRALASRKIYVERREEDRLRDVVASYRWRGWDGHRIAALLADRDAEEVPLVEGSSRFADLILKEPDHDRM
jgi:uridine kinase